MVADYAEPGSSPLARGAPTNHADDGSNRGLIPARAGSTKGIASTRLVTKAHPRSRGEHPTRLSITSIWMGSSPLARGAPGGEAMGYKVTGLIPARAGSTHIHLGLKSKPWAHPRSRGEHSGIRCEWRRAWGSSPLARGAHLLTWGFTPYTSKIESL